MAETSGAGTDVPLESIIYMIGQQLSFKNKWMGKAELWLIDNQIFR